MVEYWYGQHCGRDVAVSSCSTNVRIAVTTRRCHLPFLKNDISITIIIAVILQIYNTI